MKNIIVLSALAVIFAVGCKKATGGTQAPSEVYCVYKVNTNDNNKKEFYDCAPNKEAMQGLIAKFSKPNDGIVGTYSLKSSCKECQ